MKDAVHILTAEDSPTQAQRLRHTLESNGYQVTTTPNGKAALEAAQKKPPTLIISDIIMPEMDGYQLCQQIKADPKLKDVPVILLTTLSDPQDVIRALECGADNFIMKPFDDQYLLSRIEFVLLNTHTRQRDNGTQGVEVFFNGNRHVIHADRLQILNLLLCTYETAILRNQELSHAKDDLRKSNAALEATNKELETFSYSVSHDLRAPLRAIDGFSAMLSEDHGEHIPKEGRDLLSRIRTACERMRQLIDDLLNLARLARTQVNSQNVDLSKLVRNVLGELERAQPDRKVTLRIAEGLSASCDSRLMQIVLENLLNNAWKFTAKREGAVIEFGVTDENGEMVYFVRDNGAGFDMAHAEKLFGAFQRLHTVEEFAGTGVGLATVQRIIQRHGGRIWAQGKVNEGAMFSFTL